MYGPASGSRLLWLCRWDGCRIGWFPCCDPIRWGSLDSFWLWEVNEKGREGLDWVCERGRIGQVLRLQNPALTSNPSLRYVRYGLVREDDCLGKCVELGVVVVSRKRLESPASAVYTGISECTNESRWRDLFGR